MATIVTRDARENALKSVMMSAMRGGGVDGVVARILDVLDDLNDAITFFAQWKRGTLLDLEPGRKLDRWETIVRLNQRMDRDPELYAEMLRQPRYLAALTTQEAIGAARRRFPRPGKGSALRGGGTGAPLAATAARVTAAATQLKDQRQHRRTVRAGSAADLRE